MGDTTLITFASFVFLSIFNAGAMTTLQLQHYGIYDLVGRETFAAYIGANNRAALVPVILPALLLLLTSAILLVRRPAFMHASEAIVAFGLNVVQLASTILWQRRLQAEMARSGYDQSKTRLLRSTNWIRTIAFLALAALAVTVMRRGMSAQSRNGLTFLAPFPRNDPDIGHQARLSATAGTSTRSPASPPVKYRSAPSIPHGAL